MPGGDSHGAARCPIAWKKRHVFTVGHSTRTLAELVALLRAFGVSVLVDIRTIPRSRHNPQFNEDTLRASLRARRLRYAHLAELGGLRKARKDSPNAAWRNTSFRGYADYMQTEGFAAGLAKLEALASQGTVALMCAEAVPWRCHRSLVADALTARGARVEHLSGSGRRASPHKLTRFATVQGTRVAYPARLERPLATAAPFHLEATVRVLQRRPGNRVDLWEQDRYVRVLRVGGELVLAEVANRGTIDRPDVWLSLLGPEHAEVVETTLRQVLGLDLDPRVLGRAAATAPRLAPTAQALRGLRPPRFAGLFDAFASVVPFQQVSLDSGAAIVDRLVERFGETLAHGDRTFHAFPRAEAVAGARLDALKRCGMTGRKAETLRRIARAIASGELSEGQLADLSSEEAIRRLCELPGIGSWSAALVLLRGLGRLEVFPPGDVGVARGLGALLGGRAGRSIDRAVERFGEQRGYLYFFALGDALLLRGLVHAAPPPAARRSTRARAAPSR